MGIATRTVLPELLDELDPTDPRAQRSRQDLRRVHRVMGSVSILRRAIAGLRLAQPPRTLLELGAGDGSLLLRLAGTLPTQWRPRLTLLDRHDLVLPRTRDGYRRRGWDVAVQCADVCAWAHEPTTQPSDLCVTTLFLHHFAPAELGVLLSAIARNTRAFVACEPRRDVLSRLGSLGIGLIGGNAVTRADGVKSVAAGFYGRELTAAWEKETQGWRVSEYRALPFSHCFSAVRDSARIGVDS